MISKLYNSTVLFFLFYSIHIISMPNSRHIALALLIVRAAYLLTVKKKRLPHLLYDNRFKKWVVLLMLVFVYTVFITYFREAQNSGYTTYISTTFNYLVMMIIVPPLLLYTIDSGEEFCESLVLATVVHSLIIIASMTIPSVRTFLQSIQDPEIWENFRRYSYRVIGLGVVGAGGSVYLTCGFAASVYLFLSANKKRGLNTVSMVLIIVAIALIGRTGFYVSCCILIYALFKKGLVKAALYSALMALLIGTVFILVSKGTSNDGLLKYTIGRLGEIFQSETTLDTLAGMNNDLPGISWYTLFGSGIIRGIASNGLRFSHDSGYAKRYAAIGAVMALNSYIFLFNYIRNLARGVSKSVRNYVYVLTALLFIIEYKEPFIYMYTFPLLILMLLYYSERQKNTRI